MSKKIALVTGGTRGIGDDISRQLKADGFTVIANYHANDDAAKTFNDDTGIETIKFDASNFQAVQDAVQSITDKHGPISVLVNNAGRTNDGFLHKMTEEQWDTVLNTNLKSMFNLCRAVVPAMREASFGRIINIASVNAQKGQLGQANYCAAKAGIIGFSKALALESARKNITVNVVCPGYIETDMTAKIDDSILQNIVDQIPMGRLGTTGEIAGLVGYLASDKAGYSTGAVFSMNGGQYMA